MFQSCCNAHYATQARLVHDIAGICCWQASVRGALVGSITLEQYKVCPAHSNGFQMHWLYHAEAYPTLGRGGPPRVRVPQSRMAKHRSASEGEDSPESDRAAGGHLAKAVTVIQWKCVDT